MTLPQIDRRMALCRIGSASFLGGAALMSASAWKSASGKSGADPFEDLVRALTECPRAKALEVATRAIADGADLSALLAAVLVAGARDVRPRHVGGKLHCVMVVESIFQLAPLVPAKDAWRLALWNVDDFKNSQGIDEREGAWKMAPRPQVRFANAEAARRELEAAFEDGDAERGDRAVVGLLKHAPVGDVFEALWPHAARSFVDIGHKIIYAAQTERVLRRVPVACAEPLLRSLVDGLLFAPDGPEADAFDRARGLVARVPDGWREPPADPIASAALFSRIRRADPDEAQDLALEALGVGAGAATVWDALRLVGADLFFRRTRDVEPAHRGALLPVHGVTVTNALHHAASTTREEATRRLAILTAAGMLPRMRKALVDIVDLSMDGDGIGPKLTKGGDATSGEPLSERSFARGLAAAGAEHHQHKLAAALFEDRALVHSEFAPALLDAARGYLPDESASPSDFTRRADAALAGAGIE